MIRDLYVQLGRMEGEGKKKKEKSRTASLGVEGGRREGKQEGWMDKGIVLESCCSPASQGMGIG